MYKAQIYALRLILLFSVGLHPLHGGVVKRSDDVSLEGLQGLVQQQAAVISSLQASLASLQNTLQSSLSSVQNTQGTMQHTITELASTVATLSKAVAFSATFSADDVGNGIPLSPHAILQFDRVVTNAGNGYSPANGIFTAPVAGYYAFSIVMMEPDSTTHSSLSLSIVKNGVAMDSAWAPNNVNVNNEQGSTHTVLHLALGDQVWIRLDSGDAVRGSVWTVYTGYLVHAE